MPENSIRILFIILCIFFKSIDIYAQEVTPAKDSVYFLRNKKGIIGRIGRSISTNGEHVEPVKTVDKYKKYHGKIIRSVTVMPVGFNYDLNDTVPLRKNIATKFADALHLNSFPEVIRKNLFFKKGQPFYPLVVADNERFLREQLFLRDAWIEVFPSVYSDDSVDVVVLTKDVFSIGGSFSISNTDRFKGEIKEENFGGSGNRLAVVGMYDRNRSPNKGFGVEYLNRNIKGSFINWANGFTSFNRAFNSGRQEEVNIYSRLDKPMASRYTAVTGAAEVSYHTTINGYLKDSVYRNDFRYRFINTDIWMGYNFGHNSGKKKDSENRLRHFLAMRAIYNTFLKVPDKYVSIYNYSYADINGFLASYSLYRQNFYRSNFIYGFGRNEDVPEGINATIIAGYINKQGVQRAYYGLEFDASKFNKKEGLYTYQFKTGGFADKRSFQDVDLLMAIDHFTRLNKLSPTWYNRSFMGVSYSRQMKQTLNEPLFLESEYGLPYYRNRLIAGEMRSTFKLETVFFNMNKVLGFRWAPFLFSDLSLIQPFNEPLSHTKGYPALGGGLRTRNENLVFGTVELRGYIFPRVTDEMRSWKIELSTKLRFKYNSSFIRRPDFVNYN